jgi:D-3-phosphoglycerate dehydrogenase
MKEKILITEHIHEKGVEILRERFNVEYRKNLSAEQLLAEIKDIHGILVRALPITKEVIEEAKKLMVIARHGAGFDNVDIEAATARGIPVVYAPEAVSLSVAEHAVAVIGALAKRLFPYDRAVREDRFEIRNQFHAEDLSEKVLGIVGLGRIGRLVYEKIRAAFGMHVLVYDPFIPEQRFEQLGVTRCATLKDLLRESNFVTLHVPLNTDTRKIIGDAELALMKPTAFLINISRGDVVDETALVEALKKQRICGAAIDVFETEPPDPANPLLKLDNVILTPHSGGLTKEATIRIATDAAQGIIDVLCGRQPRYVVNPEVFETR